MRPANLLNKQKYQYLKRTCSYSIVGGQVIVERKDGNTNILNRFYAALFIRSNGSFCAAMMVSLILDRCKEELPKVRFLSDYSITNNSNHHRVRRAILDRYCRIANSLIEDGLLITVPES